MNDDTKDFVKNLAMLINVATTYRSFGRKATEGNKFSELLYGKDVENDRFSTLAQLQFCNSIIDMYTIRMLMYWVPSTIRSRDNGVIFNRSLYESRNKFMGEYRVYHSHANIYAINRAMMDLNMPEGIFAYRPQLIDVSNIDPKYFHRRSIYNFVSNDEEHINNQINNVTGYDLESFADALVTYAEAIYPKRNVKIQDLEQIKYIYSMLGNNLSLALIDNAVSPKMLKYAKINDKTPKYVIDRNVPSLSDDFYPFNITEANAFAAIFANRYPEFLGISRITGTDNDYFFSDEFMSLNTSFSDNTFNIANKLKTLRYYNEELIENNGDITFEELTKAVNEKYGDKYTFFSKKEMSVYSCMTMMYYLFNNVPVEYLKPLSTALKYDFCLSPLLHNSIMRGYYYFDNNNMISFNKYIQSTSRYATYASLYSDNILLRIKDLIHEDVDVALGLLVPKDRTFSIVDGEKCEVFSRRQNPDDITTTVSGDED